MSVVSPPLETALLERELRRRRLWYHDIELASGMRTRFPEDYDVNPVLRAVDEDAAAFQTDLDAHLPSSLAGMTVLDLGCADGLLSVWGARRGADRVVGIERNRPNFERAEFIRRAMNLDNLEFVFGPVEGACPQERFDVVFCCGLIYHLVNPLGTLHMLRNRCRGLLLITSAVDLDDGDGSPLSRLDRYTTGAHGLWSLNLPIVRQFLATAGFEVDYERVDDRPGGRHYFAVAKCGAFSAHHVFAETIDQDFPVDLERRRERVRTTWHRLASSDDSSVAVFGAGRHTPWLFQQVVDIPGVKIACVLDDRPPADKLVAGQVVRRPTEFDVKTVDAVVLSSWHQTEVLRQRAIEVFGPDVCLVSFDR